MINIFFRTLILYLAVLFIIRAMGKGELSKLDPFQMVILFMIAELAALPIESPEISIFSGLTALLTLLLLQVIFSMISLKSKFFRNLVSGKATIIVEKGKINQKKMKRLRITIEELMEQLRLKNYPSLADVDYAILEANGDMSVIGSPDKNPVNRKDMDIQTKEEMLPLLLIADGILYKNNLIKMSMDETSFKKKIAKQGYDDLNQIFICYSDEKKELHIYPKDSSTTFDKMRWDVE